MASRVSADQIKRALRSLGLADDGALPLDRMLLTLANHEAVVRMLAGQYPSAPEVEIRRSLAGLAKIVADMKTWVSPTPGPPDSDAPNVRAAKSDQGNEETVSEPWEMEKIADYDKVKIFIDGASKGNPGPASIGIVVKDLEDRIVFEEARFIGDATNNQAEYAALIAALKILVSLKRVPEAYFFSDSELLVRQMTGAYKVKSPLIQPLIAEAQTLRRRLRRFQIAHVPREANGRADRIANLAYKQAMDSGKWKVEG